MISSAWRSLLWARSTSPARIACAPWRRKRRALSYNITTRCAGVAHSTVFSRYACGAAVIGVMRSSFAPSLSLTVGCPGDRSRPPEVEVVCATGPQAVSSAWSVRRLFAAFDHPARVGGLK